MSREISNSAVTPGGVLVAARLELPWILKVIDPALVLTFSLWLTLRLASPRKLTKYVDMAVVTSLLLWFRLGSCLAGLVQSSTPRSHPTETTTSTWEVFTVPADSDVGQPLLPNVEDPEAVDAQSVCPGYTASNIQDTDSGFTAELSLAGDACNVYGNEIDPLTLTVEYQASNRLHVEIQPRYIGPENETWFLLPEVIVPKPATSSGGDANSESSDFELSWTNDPTFSFTVKRKSSGDTLFTTGGSKLVYEDQFIEFVSPLPEGYNLYGLGEVMHGFRLGNNLTRTLYAADVGNPIDKNIYGVHPVYLDTRYFQEAEGNETYVANATDTSTTYKTYTHGVFQRNAHPQEVLLRPEGITWRALGGTIDLYFYSGPSASDVVKSYQVTTVGLPAMQQYWTFGYHQCRWGYENWTRLQEVVDNFAASNIPLETIWTDIDYMNQYRDFENDQRRYGYEEGARFISKLHANGQHYVPIVDSAIYHPNPDNASDAYPTYDRGIEAGAYMMNPDESLYIGAVWPGYTVFPDWVGDSLEATNGSGAFSWWKNEITSWHQNVPFDGIWIDMSEVSSFCIGSCGSPNITLNPVHPPFLLPGEPGNGVFGYPEGFNLTNATEAAAASSVSASQASAAWATASGSASSTTTSYLRTTPTPGARNINYPPYVLDHVSGDLAVHAVSPNATHHGGTHEYDFHNLFGHQILNATYHGLLNTLPGKRPFIIGRATFAGSGQWAGHWGGDNYSVWSSMVLAISQALSFSIFGIPMFGPDVCGFAGNSDLELCSRWMQVGAFFPFYRNHNTLGASPQEPYVWESVAEASRAAMHIRYTLLPYLYTLFAEAHETGSTVLRALAFEFPEEPWLAGADHQFLLGRAILVTPVLTQGAESVDGVFPGSGDGTTLWYDWYNKTAVTGVARGQNVTIGAPLGHIPVYIRGGNVIPTQQPGKTTAESRRNPWGLLVALDQQGNAGGTLYLDDGESLEPSAATWVQLSASRTSVTAQPTGNYTDSVSLGSVTVLGIPGQVSNITLNGQPVTQGSGWSWDSATNVLSVVGFGPLTSNGTWNSDWELRWDLASSQGSGTLAGAATGGSGRVAVLPMAGMLLAMLFGALWKL